MADENEILVKISAQLDSLQSGLGEATSLVKNAASSMENAFGGAGNKGEEFGHKMESALNAGLFLEYKEIATQALEAVQSAFEATVGKAEEFGLSNAKFARIIGTTVTEATGLSEALQGVGVSTETYEGLTLRLGGRIGQNEEKFRALGIATRDSNGELLGGKAAMDAVFAAMANNPADANAIAFAAFGRQAKAAFDIARAGQEDVDKLNDVLKEMGVQTGDTSAESAQMESSLNELRVYWDAIWIAIGQRVMPIVQDFIKWIEGPGQSTMKAFATTIGLLIDVVVVLGTAFLEVGELIGGIIAEMLDWFIGWGEVWYDIVTGQFSAAVDRAKGTFTDLGDTFMKTVNNMKATAMGAVDIISKLNAPPPKQDQHGAYGATNGANPPVTGTPKADTGATARKLADEKLQAAEQEALAELKIDQDKDNFLLQSGQITADKLAQMEETLADKKMEIEENYYRAKAVADAKDPVARQKDLDKIAQIELAHSLEIQQIHERASLADRQEQESAVENQLKDLEYSKQMQEQNLSSLAAMHLLTTEEKIAAEVRLTSAIAAQEIQRIRTLEVGLDTESTAYKKYEQQILQITQQSNLQINQLNNQLQQQQVQRWQTVANSIASSFKSALSGMLSGTMSWQQALLTVVNGITNAFLDMGEKLLENWIDRMVAQQVIGDTTQATMQATTVASNAEIAASGAYAATAGIPYVGPILAPGAAATAFAATMAFAEKGAYLDDDGPVFAHKKEMILPASISTGLNAMIQSGGGAGDTHLHYSPTIPDSAGKPLKDMLEEQGRDMLSWVSARVRDGSLKAPR